MLPFEWYYQQDAQYIICLDEAEWLAEDITTWNIVGSYFQRNLME